MITIKAILPCQQKTNKEMRYKNKNHVARVHLQNCYDVENKDNNSYNNDKCIPNGFEKERFGYDRRVRMMRIV